MRDDVVSIEVSYPHPFLELGVELIDLPGTNDRDEQDTFVRERLLAADLVVNVLDVRKLMTLGEREHLRDWLENRGINTVVFVANFTNLLEPEEQREVQQRLRFVAESFRSDLPAGISNLYRVDALPALRARLKGDDATLHTSGLSAFISALQAIVTHQKSALVGVASLQENRVRQPRLQAIAIQLRGLLSAQIAQLEQEINTRSIKAERELSLKRQAQQLIQAGWENSLKELEQWLYLPNLISCYQTELATATQQGIFPQWEATNIAPKLEHFQREINDWVVKATEFFNVPSIASLTLTAPEPPDVLLPSPHPRESTKSTTDKLTPTALVTGLGWLMGGPVGAVVAGGASILADKLDRDRSTTKPNHAAEVMAAYIDASADYLLQLNTVNIARIKDYRSRAVGVINVEINSNLAIDPIQQQKLANLSATLDRLM